MLQSSSPIILNHRMKPFKQFFPSLLLVSLFLRGVAGATEAPPRVFLFDAQFLQSARQRLRSGDTNLAPALAQLERDAHEDVGRSAVRAKSA